MVYEQEPQTYSPNITTEVRYVLSGQPTGWTAMADRMRAYDEEKVRDTKEDIDTLLVFAGLFSAVLTAFLVESYKSLSPDTSSQMLVVMQQVSMQMVSFSTPSGTINSTYQPLITIHEPGKQPFQPTATDIRVNVLWFASLIFSLVTASFGMLVKQWLREYLAVTNPSPQARLRIRHFRYPELQRWKVFEIAALLPLLQQVSLALFFIGLCYFTQSVHESVGYTTLPLVAGWAFCIVTVTILPLFFPRCPYKTTLLKQVLASVHLWALQFTEKLALELRSHFSAGRFSSVLGHTCGVLRNLYRYNDERYVVSDESMDITIMAEVDAVQANDELLGTAIFESLQQIPEPRLDDAVNFVLRMLEHRLQRDDLVSGEPAPIELWSLSRTGYTAIIDILAYFTELKYVKNPTAYSEEAYATVFYILSSPSHYPLPASGTKLFRGIFQHMSHGPGLIDILFRSCTMVEHSGVEHGSKFGDLVDRISNMLRLLDVDLDASLRCFEALVNARFRGVHGRPARIFTVNGDLTSWPWYIISDCHRELIVDFLIEIVRGYMLSSADILPSTVAPPAIPLSPILPTSGRFVDALAGMFNMADPRGPLVGSSRVYAAYWDVVNRCLAEKRNTPALLKALQRVQTPALIRIYSHWYQDSPRSQDTEEMIRNIVIALSESTDSPPLIDSCSSATAVSNITPSHALRILCVGIHLVMHSTARKHTTQWIILFRSLMDLVHQSMRDAYSFKHPVSLTGGEPTVESVSYYTAHLTQSRCLSHGESAELAAKCLAEIQLHDRRSGLHLWNEDTQAHWAQWASAFKTDGYAFQDELVEMLAAIYFASGGRDVGDSEWWRVKQLGTKERVRAALAVHMGGDPLAGASSDSLEGSADMNIMGTDVT